MILHSVLVAEIGLQTANGVDYVVIAGERIVAAQKTEKFVAYQDVRAGKSSESYKVLSFCILFDLNSYARCL